MVDLQNLAVAKVIQLYVYIYIWGFPDGASGKKNSPANAGDTRDVGLIPGLGRSPGGGNENLLQYSCLGHFMDGGAWWATVHGSHTVRHDLMTEQDHTSRT